MKSPLFYLLLHKLKNNIKSVAKSPAKLIYAIVMIGLLVLMAFTGGMGEHVSTGSVRDMRELFLIVSLFYTMMFLLLANNGFNDGTSIFKMPDVNFLFAGPFTPRRVLFYGLVQQLGTSLLMAFFIFFQYSWLQSSYGIDMVGLIAILFGYALMAFMGQLVSMIIYATISGNELRRRVVKTIFYSLAAVLVAQIAFLGVRNSADILGAVPAAAESPIVRYFPVGGWIACSVVGIITGDLAMALPGIILTVLGIAGSVAAIVFMNPDFYEDVLGTTEKVHFAQAEAASGKVREWSPKKVKVGAGAIGKGFGADVFFYKHKLENRRSRALILDLPSMLFIMITIATAFFMRGLGLVSVLAFSLYMQIFSVSLGRFIKELTKPFIYLVPESPVKKLFWSMRESLTGFALDAVITAVPVGLLLGTGIPEIIVFALARFSFSMLVLTSNLAGERIFGTVTSKMLILTFYFVTVLIMAAPGAALAIALGVTGNTILSLDFTVCLAIAAVNLPVSMLVLYLCRGILDYAEFRG